MREASIFPRSWLLALWLCAGTAVAQTQAVPQDSDADLLSRKPVHEQRLKAIEQERRAFALALSKREEKCLAGFFSSSCLEGVRTDHLREMRRFDLLRETELQALRSVDAELRARSRARRVSEKDQLQREMQEKPRPPLIPPSSSAEKAPS